MATSPYYPSKFTDFVHIIDIVTLVQIYFEYAVLLSTLVLIINSRN